MEDGKSLYSTGSNKIAITKTKAVGVFRTFLNFLQKPARKRLDNVQNNNSNHHDDDNDIQPENVSTTLSQKQIADPAAPTALVAPQQRRNAFRSWSRFKLWSHSGSNSAAKKDVTLTRPELEQSAEDLIRNDLQQEVERKDGNLEDQIEDDEVFLNGSYFEDDYTEDYSSPTSSGEDLEIYKCCDVPEALFEDALNDCMYLLETHHDNLHLLESAVKNYDKVLPKSMTMDNGLPNSDVKRQRRYSAPYNFPLVRPSVSNNISGGDGNILNTTPKPVDCSQSVTTTPYSINTSFDDIFVTPAQSISKINREASAHFENTTPKPKIKQILTADVVLDNYSSQNSNLDLGSEVKHSSNASKMVDIPFDPQFPSVSIDAVQQVCWSNNPTEKTNVTSMAKVVPSSPTNRTPSSLKVINKDDKLDLRVNCRRSSSGSIESGYRTASTASPALTPFSPLPNPTTLPQNYFPQNPITLPQKYFPPNPVTLPQNYFPPNSATLPQNFSPFPQRNTSAYPAPHDFMMPQQNPFDAFMPHPFTPYYDSSVTLKSYTSATSPYPFITPITNFHGTPASKPHNAQPLRSSYTSPRNNHPTTNRMTFSYKTRSQATPRHHPYLGTGTPPKPVITPLTKLRSGIPLSPNSRNTLDGIITPSANRYRPCPTPRQTKLKFVFPSPTNSPKNTSVPASDVRLQPVNEAAESISNSDECTKIESKCFDLDPNDIVNWLTSSNEEISPPKTDEPSLKEQNTNTFRMEHERSKITPQRNLLNPYDLDEPELVSIVDLLQSTSPKKDELPPGSLSCLPPSPPRYQTPQELIQGACGSPFEMAFTPIHRPPPLGDNLNDIVVTSPFDKSLYPLCTSSPMPNKFAPKPRRHNIGAAHTDPTSNRSILARVINLESSMKRAQKYNRSYSPSFVNKTPRKQCKTRDRNQKLNSEKRKRLVKRKSARMRLNFDRKDSEQIVNDSEMTKSGVDSPRMQNAISGDYVLLKRIAEDIAGRCSHLDLIHPWLNKPGLMENLNIEYNKIMKSEKYKSKDMNRISQLKQVLKRQCLSNLTVENCLDVVLMSFLVEDHERISASLDFVFENLPRVAYKHYNLSHLAPEIVQLLLSNQRVLMKNNHGFPLPYSQSEKEVFKAVMKYTESMKKKYEGKSVSELNRVKSLLCVVTDPGCWEAGVGTSSADKRLLKDSQMLTISRKNDAMADLNVSRKHPLRKPYGMLFTKPSQFSSDRNREYLFHPFISSHINSLDEIDIAKGGSFSSRSPSTITLSDISNENHVLRKLYFSYRRCSASNIPFITKIGMQYSLRGKKKSVFIAPARITDTLEPMDDINEADVTIYENVGMIGIGKSTADGHAGNASDAGTLHNAVNEVSPETTVVKRAAMILKAGEHITAVSILGRQALHNIEIFTNTGRRIRAHSIQDVPPGTRWVALATPTGNAPFCLHTLYGDLHKSTSGRATIRNLGALWVSTTKTTTKLTSYPQK